MGRGTLHSHALRGESRRGERSHNQSRHPAAEELDLQGGRRREERVEERWEGTHGHGQAKHFKLPMARAATPGLPALQRSTPFPSA